MALRTEALGLRQHFGIERLDPAPRHPGPPERQRIQGERHAPFRAESERRGEVVAIQLEGRLDSSAVPRFQAALEDAAVDAGRPVELHLDRLEDVDCSGVASVVAVNRRVRSLVLVNPTCRVDRALRAAGLEGFFAVRHDHPSPTPNGT